MVSSVGGVGRGNIGLAVAVHRVYFVASRALRA